MEHNFIHKNLQIFVNLVSGLVQNVKIKIKILKDVKSVKLDIKKTVMENVQNYVHLELMKYQKMIK